MIPSEVGQAVGEVVGYVLHDRRKATKYLNPKMVVKASAQHRPRRDSRQRTVIVTVGTPNYAEREFIKAAKRAGEPFPVGRVQLKDWR